MQDYRRKFGSLFSPMSLILRTLRSYKVDLVGLERTTRKLVVLTPPTNIILTTNNMRIVDIHLPLKREQH